MLQRKPRIVVLAVDCIGPEVMNCAMSVLRKLLSRVSDIEIDILQMDAGANSYLQTGTALSEKVIECISNSDGVLLGAMGLPNVRYPDGTEIIPQIELRKIFSLYAGVRPIRLLPGAITPLSDVRVKSLDFTIIRESTEGLFAHMNEGKVENNQVAEDKLEITREASERVFDFAFRLAENRKKLGYPGKVTCIDKANVFKSMAFFRQIFEERAVFFPNIITEVQYVDAAALNLVLRPWDYDVIVTENMFGDILSDLGAGLIGGMGMAPSGDIGDKIAVFQPSHGTAPDIAGMGKANPTAMILSLVLLLEWLSNQGFGEAFNEGAKLVDIAVCKAYQKKTLFPYEVGGNDGTQVILNQILEYL